MMPEDDGKMREVEVDWQSLGVMMKMRMMVMKRKNRRSDDNEMRR